MNGKCQLLVFCVFGDKTQQWAERTLPFPMKNFPKVPSKTTTMSNSEGRYIGQLSVNYPFPEVEN